MNRPILAKSDERALERLVASLPHVTIIVAEPGLDVERFIGEIVSSQPSQIFNVSPQENKSTIISISQNAIKILPRLRLYKL